MTSDRSSRPQRLGWAITVLAAGLIGAWVGNWHQEPETARASDIVVVRAPAAVVMTVPHASVPARAVPVAVSAEAAVANVRRAYPLLSDVAMTCQADRCALTATIRPLTTQADLDRRQEMLLGGLAAMLAADGYRLAVPFAMDEVDDNLFHIRASVTRDTVRDRSAA